MVDNPPEEAKIDTQGVDIPFGGQPPPIPVHLLYLQDPYPRRRLATLVDFLVAKLS